MGRGVEEAAPWDAVSTYGGVFITNTLYGVGVEEIAPVEAVYVRAVGKVANILWAAVRG